MNQDPNILVIGGTGKTGRQVVEKLKKRKCNILIGSRNSNPVFDWADRLTWAKALEGIDRVYITYYPDLAVPGAYQSIKELIREMINAGVEKTVLLSGKGEKEAERCERLLAASVLDYTIIRASWFNQNFSEGFLLESILAGHVALPMSHVRIPFVDTRDIAEAVVKVLLDDIYNGQTYEITGPRTLTFKECVVEIEKNTGRNIKYEELSLASYSKVMKSAGLPPDYIWLINYLFKEVLGNEANQRVSGDFEKLMGRKPKDFKEYALQIARTGVWNQSVPMFV